MIPFLPIGDDDEFVHYANGQEWRVSWHPPHTPPAGTSHGSAGICVTNDREVVIVSSDGVRWDFPAGRPESDESLEDTLRREMQEEACALVTSARLLGFSRGRCVRGRQEGLILVRAYWRADVVVGPWNPQFEIAHRRLVSEAEVLNQLNVDPVYLPLYRRALDEARIL